MSSVGAVGPVRGHTDWDAVTRLLAAGVCCILLSCSTSPVSSVDLEGRVDEKMVEAAAALKYPPGSFISIESYGGKTASAYRVAKILRQKGLGVEVRHLCLSACASMIFVGAPMRRILPGGIVALHGSDAGFLLFSRQSVGAHVPPVHPQTHILASQELALYREAKVQPDFLYAQYVKAGRVCYSTDERDSPFKGSYNLGTQVTAYAPSAATFRAFGIEVEGENAQNYTGPSFYLPENPSVSISLDNGKPLTPQAVDAQVRSMKIYHC